MCRIFGVAYGENREEISSEWLAKFMYPAAVHLGPHAYGWMHSDGKTIEHEKYQGSADNFDALAKVHIPDDCHWFVGHTRWATHGDPAEPSNNHPIIHRNLVGVHNGILRNHEDILRITGRENPVTEVDSEAIFAAVSKWGRIQGLQEVNGDMVAVWASVDAPENLWIARSYGRELIMGRTEAGNLAFASEAKILKASGLVFPQGLRSLQEWQMIKVRHGLVKDRAVFESPYNPKPAPKQSAPVKRTQFLSGRPSPRSQSISGGRPFLQRPQQPLLPYAEVQQSTIQRIRHAHAESEGIDARNLTNGDEWNGWYFYDGKFLKEEEYLDELEAEMNFAAEAEAEAIHAMLNPTE